MAQRPLIACVIDLRPELRQPDVVAVHQAVMAACYPGKYDASDRTLPWHEEVEFLFHSLRRCGGSLRDARAEVHYVGSLDPELARRLTALDVTLKPAAVMDIRLPLANKLRMLETTTPYDVMVMLDFDIVIARDFSDYLRTDVIQALPSEQIWIADDLWELLYDWWELPPPTMRYHSPTNGEETMPYFNSGVIFVPQVYARTLHDAWLYYIRLLLDRWDEMPVEFTEIVQTRYFVDEIALAAAICAARLTVTPLPLEMNFPTHMKTPPALPGEPLRIIHNHHRLTHMGLHESPYEEINALFATLNETIDSGGVCGSGHTS